MGYAGGTQKDPTYHDLGDHSETVQLDFDPEKIAYADLLKIFWQAHDPAWPSRSRQYRTALFFHDGEQETLALLSREKAVSGPKTRICTELLPYSGFTLAEAYHQKFYLRQEPSLIEEFRAMYPDLKSFVDSTAAARANGYIAGYGRPDMLNTEIELLGLSPAGQKRLIALTRR